METIERAPASASAAGAWQRRGNRRTVADLRRLVVEKYGSDRIAGGEKSIRRFDHNTVVFSTVDGNTVYRFWDTDIVTVRHNGDIILNSGGFHSYTTKERMNEILRRHDDPLFPRFVVFAKNGLWYIGKGGYQSTETWLFRDGITLSRNGTVRNALNREKMEKRERARKKRIEGFLEYAREKLAKEWPVPSGGDCWFCALSEVKTGRSWGDVAGDTDHLWDHIKRKYFHGSLLFRAYQSRGYGDPGFVFQVDRQQRNIDVAIRNLRAYLKKSLLGKPDKEGA